jgi:hypothetical protein
MDKFITYVGLNVHKDTIAIALAESGKRGEVREYGKIPNTPAAVKVVAAKLAGSSGCGCFPSPALIVGRGLAHQVEKIFSGGDRFCHAAPNTGLRHLPWVFLNLCWCWTGRVAQPAETI